MTHQDTTMFLIICSAMVLFMTPGLAFFYGGLVRASSVVSMMMMSFGSLALIAVMWVVFGYAVSFGAAGSGNFVGLDGVIGIDLDKIFLADAIAQAKAGDGFNLAFASFQGTFAIITVALISGAIADRAKFGSWMLFGALWACVVYFPVAGWVFNFSVTDGKVTDGGWLVYNIGVMDFAGGTVVEIASGASALALALVVGKRFGFTKGMHAPHNVPLTLIGAAILWFGWFGFNAGSELAADGVAALAFMNTLAAPVGAMLSWVAYEQIMHKKPTSVGAASGAVAGLVAITPSCAFLTPVFALLLGLIVGVTSALAIELKYLLGFDDSLDVVGIHLVGGLVGTLYIGLFGNGVGAFFGFGFEQLGKQAIGAVVVLVFSFTASYVIGWLIQKTIGFRVTSTDEIAGVDRVLHGETAYSEADPRWSWRG
ncbi:ammonium transporter [Rhodoluna lacicola]|uniref:ammonium transporter n=1 Tax=Rhodoluna lacicola TaxID=529884 RepID=UPI00222FEC89|nr:ammonium transporter [Rhodoluna lacicola]